MRRQSISRGHSSAPRFRRWRSAQYGHCLHALVRARLAQIRAEGSPGNFLAAPFKLSIVFSWKDVKC